MAVTENHLLLMALVLLSTTYCKARRNLQELCPPSTCGNVKNISYPFRLRSDPKHCGNLGFELECENNQTLLSDLNFCQGFVEVQSISYSNFSMRLRYPSSNYTFETLPVPSKSGYSLNRDVSFVLCEAPIESERVYVNVTFGTNHSALKSSFPSSSSGNSHFYAVIGESLPLYMLEDGCSVMGTVLVSSDAPFLNDNYFAKTPIDVGEVLSYGFELSWLNVQSAGCRAGCYFHGEDNSVQCTDNDKRGCYIDVSYLSLRIRIPCKSWIPLMKYGIPVGLTTGIIVGARFLIGFICLLIYLLYKWRRTHLSTYKFIEDFLQETVSLMPIRYSYSDVKKITKNFQDKIGEGGYGTVYRGRLRSGIVVAVKMMGKSTTNAQEFISEVATIGRIHHVNVVRLVGFCAQGSKRALLYEFMPNGSLEKHIFRQEEYVGLSWDKIFHISVGVAHGIDYLHRGCDMRILHFDIKPHNILLDENFVPKISDFGLAKLYERGDSITSLTAARGTMGYMAPELFYKNIGGISHKADVYSFGMLLMEMIGKRKNLNPFVDQVSQIYFPSWAYKQYAEGKEIEIGDANEDERKMVRKMIIVALWCIQMRPDDRPSMNKVIGMLEGELELLQMPANPLVSFEELSSENDKVDIVNEGDANDAEEPLLS